MPHVKSVWTNHELIRKFMKLVEPSGSIGLKVHEQAWNHHEIGFARVFNLLSYYVEHVCIVGMANRMRILVIIVI